MDAIAEISDGNIVYAFIIGGLMLISSVSVALISNGYLSRMLKGKGRSNVELAAEMDEIKKGFVPNLDEALAGIDGKLDALAEGFQEMERRLGHVDKSALMAVIHNPEIHAIDRLRAFDRYLRLGGNGLVEEYAIRELILRHRKDWIRTQQENRMRIYCEKEKYEARIAEIDRRTKL